MEQNPVISDDLGPLKIIHIHQPTVNLRATLVIDNVARGPSVGGMRMALDVSTEECVRLARAMTLKNAAADLPHGGGKMVIYADPNMPAEQKEPLLRCLAGALRTETDYLFAPDMGTDEICMAWIKDEVGRAVGLPRNQGGIPLNEIGATAWGLVEAIEVACDAINLKLSNCRFVMQGFGAVGMNATRFLCQRGATLVAAADWKGAIANADGLDIAPLIALQKQGRSITELFGAQRISPDQLLSVECDIWVPAARPDVINSDNVDQLNTRMLPQGANIPATAAAEQRLHERDILVIPDFIANAGGIICGSLEYQGCDESMVLPAISEKVRRNSEIVIADALKQNILPREAALKLARSRLENAMSSRRWSLF